MRAGKKERRGRAKRSGGRGEPVRQVDHMGCRVERHGRINIPSCRFTSAPTDLTCNPPELPCKNKRGPVRERFAHPPLYPRGQITLVALWQWPHPSSLACRRRPGRALTHVWAQQAYCHTS